MATFVSVNVATLAKRVGCLLAWPFDLFLCSEVRLPSSSFPSLSRLDSSLGFSVPFSPSPPASETLSVSPGGMAVFVSAAGPQRLGDEKKLDFFLL